MWEAFLRVWWVWLVLPSPSKAQLKGNSLAPPCVQAQQHRAAGPLAVSADRQAAYRTRYYTDALEQTHCDSYLGAARANGA